MNHIIIIGTGHIGRDFAKRMRDLDPLAEITLIGDEAPYSRINLVKLLEGKAVAADLREPSPFKIIEGTVTKIDRAAKAVCLGDQRIQYDFLVLATGATPIVLPDSPTGVFPLRTDRDAELIARYSNICKKVAVLGGGTLGVETAVALKLRNPNLQVTLLNADPVLLKRMLDKEGSEFIAKLLEKTGILIKQNAHAKGFVTAPNIYLDAIDRVAGIELDTGEFVPADLVVSAIGVFPNDMLAYQAGLACKRGIVVDADCRTTDSAIFAIGDCTSGSRCILETGFEQAKAAASAIAGKERESVAPKPVVTRLKTHHKAYSVGLFDAAQTITYRRPHAFRKLFLTSDNRLVGAIVFGGWNELPAIEQAVLKGETLSPVRQLSFKHFGMTSAAQPKPQNWADDAVICQCKQVTKGQIVAAAKQGATVEQVSQATGAGTGCGGCKPLIAQLLNVRPEPIKNARPMGAIALEATVLALLLIAFSIPYPATFGNPLRALWADDLMKQITGYTVLALAAGLAAIGIRKRVKATPYDAWKLVHVALGLSVLFALVAHSGGRFGAGLTFGLTTSFVGTALTGALLAMVFAKSHKLDAGTQTQARKALHWLHVLFLWPLPVLLGFHIATFYLWS